MSGPRLTGIISAIFIAASFPANSAIVHVNSSGMVDELHEWLPQSFFGKNLSLDFYYDDEADPTFCGAICIFDSVLFSSAEIDGYRAQADNGVVVNYKSTNPLYNTFNFRPDSMDSKDGDCCAPEGGVKIYGDTIKTNKPGIEFFPTHIGILQQSSISFTDDIRQIPQVWPDLSQLDVAKRVGLCFSFVRNFSNGPARNPEDIACMNATISALSFSFVKPLPGCGPSGGVPPKCDDIYPKIDSSLPLVNTDYLQSLPAPVPLPASALLFLGSMGSLAVLRRRKNRV